MPASSGSPPRERERGFTLVELMVSVILAAIAVMGVMALYRVQTGASGFSRHTTEAAVLVGDQMEYLRTQTVPVASTQANLNELGKSGGIFTRTSTVAPTTEYIDYSVTVTWLEDSIPKSTVGRSRRSL